MTAPWRVFYCLSRSELKVESELRSLGVETFVPFERFKRHRKRKNVVLGVFWDKVPLFGNYVFARTNGFARVSLIAGVLAPVQGTFGPVVVPDRVIARLKELCDGEGLVAQADLTKNSFWFQGRPGDTVKVRQDSPFAGFLGKISSIARLDETGEIRAWLELFGGAVEVTLPSSSVSLIEAAA